MKNALSVFALTFVFCTAAALAQTGGMGSQGTTSESPSMQSGQSGNNQGNGTMGQGSGTMGQDNGSMGQGNGNMQGNSSSSMKEKKMKGCVQQQNGQYVLQTKKGHTVNLTGADVSAHVGHEVAVHGTWGGGSMSSTSTGGDHTFNVTSVDMISEHCSMGGGKSGSSSGMSSQQ